MDHSSRWVSCLQFGCINHIFQFAYTVGQTLFHVSVEADLGKFSEVVYKKLLLDAKKQRFQGFRPGTIPPQLLGTYKAFAMDEVCRETTLEAMQQNNIRPFDGSREEMEFVTFSIPPPAPTKKKKKEGGKNKKGVEEIIEVDPPVEEPVWKSYDTMKAAIDGGWQPGQSFSFVSQKVKGQKVAAGGIPAINPLAG
jgi:Bacterial trigger factor protein (TF)